MKGNIFGMPIRQKKTTDPRDDLQICVISTDRNYFWKFRKLFGNAELRRSVGIVQSGICQYILALTY